MLGTKTFLYAEDRGLQVPMAREHDKIGWTQFCDQLLFRSNGSINYTARTDIRLFLRLNKGRVEGNNLFLSANKKPNDEAKLDLHTTEDG
jgi:hypothetical protein